MWTGRRRLRWDESLPVWLWKQCDKGAMFSDNSAGLTVIHAGVAHLRSWTEGHIPRSGTMCCLIPPLRSPACDSNSKRLPLWSFCFFWSLFFGIKSIKCLVSVCPLVPFLQEIGKNAVFVEGTTGTTDICQGQLGEPPPPLSGLATCYIPQ